jgi:hypothetical protein
MMSEGKWGWVSRREGSVYQSVLYVDMTGY